MLYALIALAGLFAVAKSEEDGEFYSDDDSAEQDGGMGVSVLQADGEPLVLFYRGDDSAKKVYCFKFVGSYEAATAADVGGDELDGSYVDFGEDVEWNYQGAGGSGDDAFAFRIYSMDQEKWDALNLTFTEVAMEDGYTALHFDIAIRGYEWAEGATDDSVFVLEVDLDDCSDEYSQERASNSVESADSEDDESGEGEDDGESGGEDGEEDSEDEVARRLIGMVRRSDIHSSHVISLRRRMQDDDDDEESGEASGDEESEDEADSNSADESEGVSSDDSREYDLEAAVFEIEDTATGEFGTVNVSLQYEAGEDALSMVFGYFGASLDMDPTLSMDSDKVDSDAASSLYPLFSLALALIGAILA